VQLLGLALVAATPRNRTSDTIRRQRCLVSGLFEHVWSIGWHDYLLDTPVRDLPAADPGATVAKKFDPQRHVAADLIALGNDLRDLAQQSTPARQRSR